MRAVFARQPGGAEQLHIEDVEIPTPGPQELLIKVAAAAINRADINQREGNYPMPDGVTEILGLEAAGEVVEVGNEVDGWAVGDKVCALLIGGGYAEYVTVPASIALPWPAGSDEIGAASVYEVFATAFDNLFNRAGLLANETVLLHGGSSGIGTAAIQMAKRAGCRVIATVGSSEKVAACKELGADDAINYRESDFVAEVSELTDGRGVDVILDLVGADYLDRNLQCLAMEGRLSIIALQSGSRAELDLKKLQGKRARIMSSTLRKRTTEEKAQLADQLRSEVWPGFADGSLKPVIDSTFALEDVADAHRLMEASTHIGKIVLTVAG